MHTPCVSLFVQRSVKELLVLTHLLQTAECSEYHPSADMTGECSEYHPSADRRVFRIPSFCRQASVQNLQIGECSESADRRVFRIPSFRIRPIGQRSFSPTTWNRLPVSVPCAASSCSFKSSLKTILFSKSVSSVPLP